MLVARRTPTAHPHTRSTVPAFHASITQAAPPGHQSPVLKRAIRLVVTIWILLAGILPAGPVALAQEPVDTVAPDAPFAPDALDWIEPRGLSVVDVVGQVPEAHLKGAILTYSTSTGMAHYVSGSRTGNTVVINTQISPRYSHWGSSLYTYVGCLGQIANYDQWPSTSPAGTIRLFSNGVDVTHLLFRREIVPAGLYKPRGTAGDYERYPYSRYEDLQPSSNPFPIPANMGCRLTAAGRLINLTATFTFTNVPPRVIVTPMGQQNFLAHSYIGVGSPGTIGPLVRQLSSRYGNRHDKFPITIPAGADFALVKYPRTEIDPYSGLVEPLNQGLPGSGSWRFVQAGSEKLSIDYLNSMLVPITGQFNDADQSGGAFLTYWLTSSRLAVPEYFVPPGIAYNSCMVSGTCPVSLLEQIYNATFPVDIYYYRVQRVDNAPLQRIPVRQVDTYDATASGLGTQAAVDAGVAPVIGVEVAGALELDATGRVLLPIVRKSAALIPENDPDNPTGCPCGYFDTTGRMFDFIP